MEAHSASRWPIRCKARSRSKGRSLASGRNTADDRPAARPKGALRIRHNGVAVLAKGVAIACARRLVLTHSEGSESTSKSETVH
ncbi:MAG: hypothetical protein B7X28_08255 [Halothiobacillus sp. 13-55-253]|nr:MAG: hypothetical protein B7X37_03730 [Halothiobacillus sp. 14-55-98]OZB79653.1 MAG: hypothetical protein B7X28_08255 [Halothiobacillus sp. 13-55-253]